MIKNEKKQTSTILNQIQKTQISFYDTKKPKLHNYFKVSDCSNTKSIRILSREKEVNSTDKILPLNLNYFCAQNQNLKTIG